MELDFGASKIAASGRSGSRGAASAYFRSLRRVGDPWQLLEFQQVEAVSRKDVGSTLFPALLNVAIDKG